VRRNIWALEKDAAIKRLLLKLVETLGTEPLELVAPDDGHPQSFVLSKPTEPGLMAFVYTFAQTPGRYGVHLEYPEFEDGPRYVNTGIYENLAYERLVQTLAVHFGSTEISPRG